MEPDDHEHHDMTMHAFFCSPPDINVPLTQAEAAAANAPNRTLALEIESGSSDTFAHQQEVDDSQLPPAQPRALLHRRLGSTDDFLHSDIGLIAVGSSSCGNSFNVPHSSAAAATVGRVDREVVKADRATPGVEAGGEGRLQPGILQLGDPATSALPTPPSPRDLLEAIHGPSLEQSPPEVEKEGEEQAAAGSQAEPSRDCVASGKSSPPVAAAIPLGVRRRVSRREDPLWAARFFFLHHYSPSVIPLAKRQWQVQGDREFHRAWRQQGSPDLPRQHLQLDSYAVQHNMENAYMWALSRRPDNAVGRMVLRAFFNGNSRVHEPRFPFLEALGFVRSHCLQRKRYKGLANPLCLHGVCLVPQPDCSAVSHEDRQRWEALTGRSLDQPLPPEALDFASWRACLSSGDHGAQPSTTPAASRPPPSPHQLQHLKEQQQQTAPAPPLVSPVVQEDCQPTSLERRQVVPLLCADASCGPGPSLNDSLPPGEAGAATGGTVAVEVESRRQLEGGATGTDNEMDAEEAAAVRGAASDGPTEYVVGVAPPSVSYLGPDPDEAEPPRRPAIQSGTAPHLTAVLSGGHSCAPAAPGTLQVEFRSPPRDGAVQLHGAGTHGSSMLPLQQSAHSIRAYGGNDSPADCHRGPSSLRSSLVSGRQGAVREAGLHFAPSVQPHADRQRVVVAREQSPAWQKTEGIGERLPISQAQRKGGAGASGPLQEAAANAGPLDLEECEEHGLQRVGESLAPLMPPPMPPPPPRFASSAVGLPGPVASSKQPLAAALAVQIRDQAVGYAHTNSSEGQQMPRPAFGEGPLVAHSWEEGPPGKRRRQSDFRSSSVPVNQPGAATSASYGAHSDRASLCTTSYLPPHRERRPARLPDGHGPEAQFSCPAPCIDLEGEWVADDGVPSPYQPAPPGTQAASSATGSGLRQPSQEVGQHHPSLAASLGPYAPPPATSLGPAIEFDLAEYDLQQRQQRRQQASPLRTLSSALGLGSRQPSSPLLRSDPVQAGGQVVGAPIASNMLMQQGSSVLALPRGIKDVPDGSRASHAEAQPAGHQEPLAMAVAAEPETRLNSSQQMSASHPRTRGPEGFSLLPHRSKLGVREEQHHAQPVGEHIPVAQHVSYSATTQSPAATQAHAMPRRTDQHRSNTALAPGLGEVMFGGGAAEGQQDAAGGSIGVVGVQGMLVLGSNERDGRASAATSQAREAARAQVQRDLEAEVDTELQQMLLVAEAQPAQGRGTEARSLRQPQERDPPGFSGQGGVREERAGSRQWRPQDRVERFQTPVRNRHASGSDQCTVIYQNNSAFLVVVSLHGMNNQRLRLTWRNEGDVGVLKVRCEREQPEAQRFSFGRMFYALNRGNEVTETVEWEVTLPQRIPDLGDVQAQLAADRAAVEVLVPKPAAVTEEREVQVLLPPQWDSDMTSEYRR